MSDTEVGDVGFARTPEQNVRWLQITVQDPVLVSGLHRTRHGYPDITNLLGRERSGSFKTVLQAAVLVERHEEVGLSGGGEPAAIQRGNARRLRQTTHGASFTIKPSASRVGIDVRQHLDYNIAIEVDLPSALDDGVAAGADSFNVGQSRDTEIDRFDHLIVIARDTRSALMRCEAGLSEP